MNSTMGNRHFLPVIALLIVSSSLYAQTVHWPTWRGPSMNGRAAEDANPPIEFGEDLNLAWKTELPGLGSSTPIVVDDRIYLTSAAPVETDGWLREDGTYPPPTAVPHRFLVHAHSRKDGSLLWQREVCQATPMEKGHRDGTFASGSIVTDGTRLFAFFGSRGVFALDMDGKLLWSKDLGEQQTLAGFGEGASPALWGDTLILPWDHEGPSALIALDTKSGDEKWRQARDMDSAWSTPIVVEVQGKPQVIVTGSKTTVGYDLVTGQPVWTCAGMSLNPTNSPLEADGVLYVMNSYKGKVIQAIRLEGAKGELSESPALIWSHGKSASYVPGGVVSGGNYFFLREDSGTLNCLDAITGETRFYGERLDDLRVVHASIMSAGKRLYIPGRGGAVVVVSASATFEQLAVNKLDDTFGASPVAIGRSLFLRGHRYLYHLRESE